MFTRQRGNPRANTSFPHLHLIPTSISIQMPSPMSSPLGTDPQPTICLPPATRPPQSIPPPLVTRPPPTISAPPTTGPPPILAPPPLPQPPTAASISLSTQAALPPPMPSNAAALPSPLSNSSPSPPTITNKTSLATVAAKDPPPPLPSTTSSIPPPFPTFNIEPLLLSATLPPPLDFLTITAPPQAHHGPPARKRRAGQVAVGEKLAVRFKYQKGRREREREKIPRGVVKEVAGYKGRGRGSHG